MTCPHGMPNSKTCVDCMEEGLLDAPIYKPVGSPFQAKWNGTCKKCGIGYEMGDMIQRMDMEDRETAYVHWLCKRDVR